MVIWFLKTRTQNQNAVAANLSARKTAEAAAEASVVYKNCGNYFEFFNIPISYNIEESALTLAYLKKQQQFHVDGDADDAEIAYLNSAYKTLLNPVSRGEYFLKLQGIDIDSMPTEAAIEMFKLREKYDSLQSEEERLGFQAELERNNELTIDKLKETSDLSEFAKIFCVLRFVNSFLEKVRTDVYSRD